MGYCPDTKPNSQTRLKEMSGAQLRELISKLESERVKKEGTTFCASVAINYYTDYNNYYFHTSVSRFLFSCHCFFFPSCYSDFGLPLLSITIPPVLCYLPPRFQRPQSPSKYRKTRCVVAVAHCQSRCILSCLFVFTRYKIRTFQFSWQGGVNRIKAHFMQKSARISAGGTRFSRGFL